MFSEALELYVEGGRVSHQLVMAMVGWVEAAVDVVDGMYAGQSQGGWSHFGRCRRVSRVRGDTLMTPDSTAVQVIH